MGFRRKGTTRREESAQSACQPVWPRRRRARAGRSRGELLARAAQSAPPRGRRRGARGSPPPAAAGQSFSHSRESGISVRLGSRARGSPGGEASAGSAPLGIRGRASPGGYVTLSTPPLCDRGPRVRLRSATDAPYDDAIAAARTCYSPRVVSPDEITDKQRDSIGPLTYGGGHHTVFQHATFEFELSGVSRQLVWSVLHGFPFYNTEQQSQRYVKLGAPEAHVPPELGSRARELYTASIERAWAAYRALTERLAPIAREILGDLWHLDRRANMAFGKSIAREAEKKAI
ncbi:MAG: FAD-dependent thymidylate synthase, partial [Deltaproteobacteria bacterium]